MMLRSAHRSLSGAAFALALAAGCQKGQTSGGAAAETAVDAGTTGTESTEAESTDGVTGAGGSGPADSTATAGGSGEPSPGGGGAAGNNAEPDGGNVAPVPDASMAGGGTAAAADEDAGANDAGMRGGDDAGADGVAAGVLFDGALLLSETGLYSDMATETLSAGVMYYEPQFTLWTDTAAKRRWLYLPEGTQIDTSDIDEWQFPVGTKIWKEFSRDDVRVETRLIEKLSDESQGYDGWRLVAYVWNDEQTDAVATPLGLSDAKGTPHDVPDQETCLKCHDMRNEKPLGVSAVQLSHEGEGATLATLTAAELLSDPPPEPLVVPGTDQERAVLGYLHANCGHCHRDNAPANQRVLSMRMWLESEGLGSVEETEAYQALVNQYSESGEGSILPYRVLGGDPDNSELMRRITTRGDGDVGMPPIGSELVDESAVTLIREWIMSIPPPDTP